MVARQELALSLEDLSYIDTVDLLKSTGIQNISEGGGEISFSCPSPEHFHGDHSPSARMNRRTTAFICHGCGQKGNAITFLSWHKSIPETVARRLLEERYGGGGISAGVGNLESMVKKIMEPEVVAEEVRIPPAESWLEKFRVDWAQWRVHKPQEYMHKRGFEVRTLEVWEIGWDEHSKRITIPIRDHEGKLVGFKGRAIEDGPYPRYMILGDREGQNHYNFQPYQKSRYVYNLSWLHWERIDRCIIVEGELNVIAMYQHGCDIAIGLAGSEFSEIQRDLIVDHCNEATLFLDNDKAGKKGTKQVIEMLSPYMPLRVVQNAPGDAAELDTKTVKELISGAVPALELQVAGKI